MFAKLLSLTAHLRKVLGIRVLPVGPSEYEVVIWIGPGVGERLEWRGTFPDSTPRPEAIDVVAAAAVQYCHAHGECVAASPFQQQGSQERRVASAVAGEKRDIAQ